jgi:hypothetical protein
MPDFVPDRDQDFKAFVETLSAGVTADPVSLGLDAGIATTLASKVTAFSTALAAATNPATRGGSTILAKDIARYDDLEPYVRQVARMIQGQITVTDQQRYDLGLTVRDTQPSPVPVPGFAPQMSIIAVSGRTVRIRLRDAQNPTRRGKPDGVIGATVLTCVSETTPTPASEWRLQGQTGTTVVNVSFPETIPAGALVWLTAYWFNSRKEAGPASTPLSTNLQGGAQAIA